MRDLEEGITYLNDICAEHRNLRGQIVATGKVIREIDHDPDAEHGHILTAERLSDLRQRVAEHFQRFLGNGHMEEALTRVPRLTSEARNLQRREGPLLAEFDRLIGAALQGDTTRSGETFDELADRLLSYLSRESDLFAEAFGTDIIDETERC